MGWELGRLRRCSETTVLGTSGGTLVTKTTFRTIFSVLSLATVMVSVMAGCAPQIRTVEVTVAPQVKVVEVTATPLPTPTKTPPIMSVLLLV